MTTALGDPYLKPHERSWVRTSQLPPRTTPGFLNHRNGEVINICCFKSPNLEKINNTRGIWPIGYKRQYLFCLVLTSSCQMPLQDPLILQSRSWDGSEALVLQTQMSIISPSPCGHSWRLNALIQKQFRHILLSTSYNFGLAMPS